MPKISVSLFQLLLLCSCVTLSGCFGLWDDPEPSAEEAKEIAPSQGPKEVISSDKSKEVGTEDELIKNAKDMFESEMFSAAKESFATLRDNYPFGPYIQFAELKAADSAFFMHDFTEASKLYEEFAKSHPSGPDTPYAQLQAARSLLKSNRGVGRNRVPLERAMTLIKSAVESKQESPYKETLLIEQKKIAQMLAEHEQLIANFYERQENEEAARLRNKRVKEISAPFADLKRSDKDESASDIATETTITPLQVPLKPLQAQAVTVETSQLEEVTPATRAPKKITSESMVGVAVPQVQALTHILKLACQKGQTSWISLELSSMSELISSALDGAEFHPTDGIVELQIPGATVDRAFSKTCFNESDVRLNENGVITVQTDKTILVGTLIQPARILLVLEGDE